MYATKRVLKSRFGFSLVELLTVIAIVALLAAILIPVVGRVQRNARVTKTRVQFSEWAAAIEAFRLEYGFYPNFDSFTDGVIDDATTTRQFAEALSGRTLSGGDLADDAPGVDAGNSKRIRFHTFGSEDLALEENPRIQDGFGNDVVVVLLDLNYDGIVRIDTGPNGGDYTAAPTVIAGQNAPLGTGDFVRAGVIFYSAGAGQTTEDVVTSW